MKVKALVLVLILVFAVGGCATLQQTIPQGCEDSFLYKSNFVPLGPVVVRLGFSNLAILAPATTPAILQACDYAEMAVNQGNLTGFIGYFLQILVAQSDDPLTRMAILNARIILETLALYPGVQNAVITDCDRNILLSLVQNIRRDIQGFQ